MPGLSFLFKKRFHPSRTDNQKRLFVAEQQTAEKNDREVELAKEVAKERDIQHFENMGSMEFRDPRTAALKFMYAAPQSKDAETSKKDNKRMASIKDYEAKIDERTGEDEMVRAFKAKIAQTKLKSLGEAAAQNQPHDVYPPEDASYEEANNARSRVPQNLSALEKEVGRRRSEVTHEQMVERFAVLKNAPMEGGYAKGMVVKHKPFSEQLRNVHCIRCGQWGHMSGERECPLRDYNPNDYARQQREDPMRRMLDGPGAGAGAVYLGSGRSSSSASGGAGISRQRCTFVDEAGDSDPEAEFLSTLTRREKKLLLRKLQALETGQPATKQGRAPHSEDSSESSSSSSSSDSESDSSSDTDSSRSYAGKHKRRRERSKGGKKRKHSHSSKKEHKKESERERKKDGKQSHKEQRRS